MASTTTNLGLMKPAYSDDADISDINGNMDLIDAEAGRVRANVAANYDSSETYAVGDYCLHDGSLYKCSTTISSPEAWTAGHWTQIKITGELSALNGNIASLDAGTYTLVLKGGEFSGSSGIYRFFHPWANKKTSKSVTINSISNGSSTISPSLASVQTTKDYLQIYSTDTAFNQSNVFYSFNVTVTVS